MALPLPPGLTPPEIAFICEMELVTIIPRQRLDGLALLGSPLKPLIPPQRASIPLWLALLLKRQRRANIIPPPWLSPESLAAILKFETESSPDAFSPPPRLPPQTANTAVPLSSPFLPSSTADASADALPYHWLELGSMLLEAASDDFEDANEVRKLLRGLREARMAKLRQSVDVLDAAGGFKMNGVGGMELGEARSFITGVVDGLRRIGKSREEARRERDRENGYSPSQDYEDDEMDMR